MPNARERWFYDRIPMGRRGKASDVAWAAVYLASDEAAYVTGVDIQVDGGYEI
jgi:3-oxoacyl-[acyl-carrier protein] reductase